MRTLRYIEAHLDSPPNLEDLSAVACFSPFYFHRIFTALTGESVAAYTRRLLLQRAASRLSYTDKKILDIALEAGYDSPDAFSRAFKAFFGITPLQYRKEGGAPGATERKNVMPLFYSKISGGVPMNVVIKPFPPKIVAARRYVGAYMECGPAWGYLCGRMEKEGLISEKNLAISLCHDDPDITPPEKCRMDVCVTLPDGMTAEDPAVRSLLQDNSIILITVGSDGKEYASVTVKGPYTQLHPVYRSLFAEWLPQSGREVSDDASFEIYYNSPEHTAPEELLTEICIPLQPRANQL